MYDLCLYISKLSMLVLVIPAIFMKHCRYLANADVLMNRYRSQQHFLLSLLFLETLLAILTINKFDDIITNH